MSEIENAVVNLVLEYIEQSTLWENAMFFSKFEGNPDNVEPKPYKDMPNELEQFLAFDPKQYKGLTQDEIRAQYEDMFQKYTTPKKREYSGKPTRFGNPAKFQGVTRENIIEVTLVNSNRCEVTCQIPIGFKGIKKFIALKKQGQWLLDSVKSYSKTDDKWSNSLL